MNNEFQMNNQIPIYNNYEEQVTIKNNAQKIPNPQILNTDEAVEDCLKTFAPRPRPGRGSDDDDDDNEGGKRRSRGELE
jgi:hypothetical protein